LTRRLAKRESDPLPDLLMVDGGKGQLGVAVAVLQDAGVELDAIGISKEREALGDVRRVRRHGGLKAEQLHLAARKDAVMLAPSSAALLLLQRVRDEAHRFAIEFQRNLRQRANLTSILEEIGGIGPRKRRALLRELGSLRAVRDASAEQLVAVEGIGTADAQRIRAFFAALDAPDPPAAPDAAAPQAS
jgi:excinuclease ABC subunit C